jgi:tetracycline repressor-like protein
LALCSAGTQLQVPDAGSVDTDLRMLARAVQVDLSAPQGAAITTALIVGGLSAPEIAGVMRQFWAGRLDAVSVIVDRAIERGELPGGHRSGSVQARDVGTAVLPAPGHLRTGHRTGRGPRCRRRAGRRLADAA